MSVILTVRNFSIVARVISIGSGKIQLNKLYKRIKIVITIFIFQPKNYKARIGVSLLHSCVAIAFIIYIYLTMSDIYTIATDKHIVHSNTLNFFVDIFSVLTLVSIVFFGVRRFVIKSKRLAISSSVFLYRDAREKIFQDSLFVLFFIFFHISFRLLTESTLIAIKGGDTYQPVASFISNIWVNIQANSLNNLGHLFWWMEVILLFAFIPYIPYSKHLHVFLAPVNLSIKKNLNGHFIPDKINFEDPNNSHFGATKLSQLDKVSISNAYSCIMCNRCQDVCPAYLTGKTLSPSAIEINKRLYLNRKGNSLLKNNASDDLLLNYAITKDALWSCTSCGACVEVCPVGNEPIRDILEIRRNEVLMTSQFPKELQNAYNGIERSSNPWNQNIDRTAWFENCTDIHVKTVFEKPIFEYLYWVGCAGAFDTNGQKIAKAFTRILNAAHVDFAILGNDEYCTADLARRTGNEYLFEITSQKNISILQKHKVKKIITTCPHCYNTIKNEYPQFGGYFEVLHHTQFINELIANHKIEIKQINGEGITYHDPCYLSRYNNVEKEPRTLIEKLGHTIVELEYNRKKSFCCGAGGGGFWKEEEKGDILIRDARINESIGLGVDTICTACPFCNTMLQDAKNELKIEIEVKDIAELIADKLLV
jgi:Fe-S oxidoreductase